jgi:acetyltransferase
MTPLTCTAASLRSNTNWLDSYPGHLSRAWMLGSGEALYVRPIRHDDDDREAAFVHGLSRESAYQRLLSGGIKITPEWIQHMTHIDYRCHMAFAVTAMNDHAEPIVGVARYVVDPAEASAEFALVIADAWQHKGLGRLLLATLLGHAKGTGVREMQGTVLSTNRGMLSLAMSVGFGVSADPTDATVVHVRRSLADPNPQSH